MAYATKGGTRKVQMRLEGLENNFYALMQAFRKNAKEQGWSNPEIEKAIAEALSDDCDHFLPSLKAHIEEPTDK